MKRVISSAIMVLTLALGVNAQKAPAAAELTTLLKDFLAGASRNDAAMHDRFWAEDLIYTGSTRRGRGKAEGFRGGRSAPAPKPGDPNTKLHAPSIHLQHDGATSIG